MVIVGAGPCGLFQAFELGLLGIEAHLVDSLPRIGGQCAFLYPEKPIYDIPALPVVGAQELIDRLAEQVRPFAPALHLGEEVRKFERSGDAVFHLATSKGTGFRARAVVIAAGVGSFRPRPLRVPGTTEYEGKNLNYRVTATAPYRDKDVVILGGGDSALDWALKLYSIAKRVTLVHRRARFRAKPASVERMKALAKETPARMRWLVGRVAEIVETTDELRGIVVTSFEDPTKRQLVKLDELLVFYGLSPDLGFIPEWGLQIIKRHIWVDLETCQTSIPGVFAVGDISAYPGKKKLILSGFHEAALAAFAVQKHLHPATKEQLLYTTTSKAVHKRLGVTGKLGNKRG